MRPYPTRPHQPTVTSVRRAERRKRKHNRRVTIAGGAAVLLSFVAALAFFVAPTADATSIAKPQLSVVGGNRAIAVSWPGVSGATSYVVTVRRGTRVVKTTTTTAHSALVTGLANGIAYATRVTATASKTGPSAVSSSVTRTTTAAMPKPVSDIKVTGSGTDQVTVTWTGGGPANRVAVIAGSTSMTDQNHFTSSWLPGSVHSIRLTVPSKLHDVLGTGSGNYIFVKVVQSNSTATSPAKGLYYDGQALYRPSASGPNGLAGGDPASDAVSKISVASWNVQSVTSSTGFIADHQWKNRISRVVANIEAAKPDLIGLQELTTARTSDSTLEYDGDSCANTHIDRIKNDPTYTAHCTEMYETLQNRLTGYKNAYTGAWRWLYQKAGNLPGAYVDSALFYDPDKFTVVASGIVSPQLDLKVSGWPAGLGDEAGTWAEFRMKLPDGTPGRSFFATSIHLPVGDDGPTAALRQREAAALSKWVDAKAGGLPKVLVGDFNSNGQTQSSAASLVFRSKGYFDVASTTNRTGQRWSSSNASNSTDSFNRSGDGYPTTAVIHPYPTSRIDYIMTKGAPYTYQYKNLIRLNSAGTAFDERYQGSDHNLQLAVIGIPG